MLLIIYEFFQNAIDRAESKIWIHLDKKKGTLTIANDGIEFSIEKGNRNYSDLESLCSINTSSKNQNESIGNKGVGFKSCWEYFIPRSRGLSVPNIVDNPGTKPIKPRIRTGIKITIKIKINKNFFTI